MKILSSKTINDETKTHNAHKTAIHKIICMDTCMYFNYTKFVKVCYNSREVSW